MLYARCVRHSRSEDHLAAAGNAALVRDSHKTSPRRCSRYPRIEPAPILDGRLEHLLYTSRLPRAPDHTSGSQRAYDRDFRRKRVEQARSQRVCRRSKNFRAHTNIRCGIFTRWRPRHKACGFITLYRETSSPHTVCAGYCSQPLSRPRLRSSPSARSFVEVTKPRTSRLSPLPNNSSVLVF